MQEILQIGTLSWTYDEIRASIPQFLELYKERPIADNQGGMKIPHMFATWYILKKTNPANVIESGVWKGQGTWLIEKTLPNANVFSIDINLHFRVYVSDKVQYFNKDFTKIDWSVIHDKENTVLFFDDHQNAIERLKKAKVYGFKQFIFEDNYPSKQGDCYSLKKAFQHSGFESVKNRNHIINFREKLMFSKKGRSIKPNTQDSDYLKEVLSIYYEFPPVLKKEKTRWNDIWDDENYPTPKPLFVNAENEYLKPFDNEAKMYTWICFAKLK